MGLAAARILGDDHTEVISDANQDRRDVASTELRDKLSLARA